MPTTCHNIDLTAPGGIEALFAFHRRTFGDAVMEHPSGEQSGDQAAPAGGGAADEIEEDAELRAEGVRALKAERAENKQTKADLKAALARIAEFESKDLSELEKATKAAEDSAASVAALTLENARYKALAANPVPAEYQHLVVGTDEASFEASAKSISELVAKAATAPPAGVVHKSGTGSGDANAGSMRDVGRALVDARKPR